MPPERKNPRGQRGLSGSFIAMGIFSLLYGGFLPLYRLKHYIVLGVLMYFVGKVYRAVSKKKHQKEDAEAEKAEQERLEQEKARKEAERLKKEAAEKKKAEAQKNKTGDAEVDALILRGQEMLEKVRDENDRLPDPVISEQIDTIESTANQIFQCVIEQPQKAAQIRRFMDYYLPTTLKMLVSYRRMEENNIQSENAQNTQQRIREALDMIIDAFQKQLEQLYEDEALDISTDIDVMETMLKQDGLIDSGMRMRTSNGEEK